MIYLFFFSEPNVGVPDVYVIEKKIIAHHLPMK